MKISENGSLEIVEMDLFDQDSVDLAISGATDVIHTAAVVIVRSRNPQEKIVDPSVIGTKILFLQLKRVALLKDSFTHLQLRQFVQKNGKMVRS
jgi:nucleoside-diphosphate-sugar epimerase